MPSIIKPDMKAALWLAIGFLVLPHVMKMVKRV